MHFATVIVSGGDAVSPFTTPAQWCAGGLAAGSTDTALREALLAAGHEVYTAPANAGPGPVTSDPGFAGFSLPPTQLPADLTIDCVGPIDAAGENLAAFLAFLHQEFDVDDVALVAHSMGGLFSRAAIRTLAAQGHPLAIRALVTLGTPWQGGFAAEYANGHLPLSAAADPGTRTIMEQFAELERTTSTGAAEQLTATFLMEPEGWNARQVGVLDSIPVTLIGGYFFSTSAGTTAVYPHDGLVTLDSALATDIGEDVLPLRETTTFDDVHSIYVAHEFDLPWTRALTWDPAVQTAVDNALALD